MDHQLLIVSLFQALCQMPLIIQYPDMALYYVVRLHLNPRIYLKFILPDLYQASHWTKGKDCCDYSN